MGYFIFTMCKIHNVDVRAINLHSLNSKINVWPKSTFNTIYELQGNRKTKLLHDNLTTQSDFDWTGKGTLIKNNYIINWKEISLKE